MLIYVPDEGVIFVGDVMMPYWGDEATSRETSARAF